MGNHWVFPSAQQSLWRTAAVRLFPDEKAPAGYRRGKSLPGTGLPSLPHSSILAPAYEESATITESVRALLAISYPNLEIIVVNDGSRDDTLQVLVDQFELVPVHPS